MAHYALINDSNTVTDVIVGADETTTAPEGFDTWEDFYADRYNCTVKRTSVNTFGNEHTNGGTAFRGNFAGIGYTYDEVNDVFLEPKPFDSWILNETTWSWIAPTSMPELTQEQIDNNSYYIWNEETQSWDLVE